MKPIPDQRPPSERDPLLPQDQFEKIEANGRRRNGVSGLAVRALFGEGLLQSFQGRGTVIYVGEITYPGDCVRLNIELIGEGRS